MWAALLMGAASALNPGPHVLEVDVVSSTRVPVLGRVDAATRTLSLVDISSRDDGLWASLQTCDIETKTSAPGRSWLPEAFVRSLPSVTFPVDVGPDGRVVLDPGPQSIGLDPSHSGGPLADLDPAAAVDTDRDGKPGATVLIKAPMLGRVELYISQFSHTRLVADSDGDALQGVVESLAFDQVTLDATHPFFRSSPRIDPGAGSRFALEPTASHSCEELMAARG